MGGCGIHFHGQADAFTGHVHFQHFDFDDVAGFHHFAGVGDELVAELADVNQAVLVHAQVHKRAKGGNVADRAFQHHVDLQVFDVFHAILQLGHFEVGARVAAWLFEFAQNVFDGDHAHGVVGKQLGLEGFEHVGAAHQLGDGFAGLRHDALDHRVGFWVNRGHVQRVVATAYAQKARALLKCFGTQARDLEQLLAVGKRAIGLAPTHHGLGGGGAQARHAGEQRHTGGVQVHAHSVDAVFHHGFEAAGEFALVHIVLVLADADGFGVNLHQLGQGVLQAAGNAGCAAQAHVHIGHFVAGVFTGAVHRGACFADHHFVDEL